MAETSEMMVRAKFCGVSRREDRKEQGKYYAALDVTVARKQDGNTTGDAAKSFDMAAPLWEQARKLPYGQPLVLNIEQFEWTNAEGSQVRKSVIGIEVAGK